MPRAPVARGFLPVSLATLERAVPSGPGWVHEAKLDGYRIEAVCSGGEHGAATLYTRNGLDWTDRFPRIAAALSSLGAPSVILDGEIVAKVARGTSAFQALQQAMPSRGTRSAVPAQPDAAAPPLEYVVFDLLALDGTDTRALPLRDRQALLKTVLTARTPRSPIRLVRRFRATGGDVLAQACALGLEGVVCKRLDGRYVSGRHTQWLKVKCTQRQEFVVVGFTEPRGARAGIGALLLAVYDGEGALQFAGKVGSGFDTAQLVALRATLAPLEQTAAPVARTAAVPRSGVHWVRPTLVAEVRFTEWTDEGLLRHPVFEGLREDKPARAVRRERPAS